MTILISGGGIGGLAVAIALAVHGQRSHVLEQAEQFSEVGAGIQIGPNGMRLLSHWGLEPFLRDRGAMPIQIRLCDGVNGRLLNLVPLGSYAKQRYGAPYRVFHRAELQEALLQKARDLPEISISTGFKVTRFLDHEDHVEVEGKNGQSAQGRLLIGADGLWSRVRTQMQPNIRPAFYGKTAWRAIVPRASAPSPFNRVETGLWMAPDAHLVHYPVQGGENLNLVAVINDRFDSESWSSPGDASELLAHYDSWHRTPRRFLGSVTGWQKWALYGLDPLETWSRGRVTLLGDAAHPPIPFLAQGGVMALEDAFVLAQQLAHYEQNHRQAFQRYEQKRQERTARVMRTAHKLGKIYHMKGLMRFARNSVLLSKKPEKLLAAYDWLYGFELDATS